MGGVVGMQPWRQTSSVGQVVPPKVTSRISASLTMSQKISRLAVTPDCWISIRKDLM